MLILSDLIGEAISTTTNTQIVVPSAPKSTKSALSRGVAAYGTARPPAPPTRLPAYVRVPFGRDPLSRGPTLLDLSDLGLSEKVSSAGELSQVIKPSKAAKITSLLYSALDAIANFGVGQIMVDGYSTSGSFEDEYFPGEKRGRKLLVERDSLGLEKATLSPGSPTPPAASLLFSSPVSAADSPSTPAGTPNVSTSPTRPRNHTRRRSLRHVSSDPILYHHHARAPSIQKRKQAFGPLDIKPYGYRVGQREVWAVFGEDEKKEEKVEEKSGGIGSAFFDMLASASAAAMMMEGEVIAAASPSSPTLSAAPLSKSPKATPTRPPSPPTPACVALQRYPIIPYNPPGPGVSAEDEVFPKVSTQGDLFHERMLTTISLCRFAILPRVDCGISNSSRVDQMARSTQRCRCRMKSLTTREPCSTRSPTHFASARCPQLSAQLTTGSSKSSICLCPAAVPQKANTAASNALEPWPTAPVPQAPNAAALAPSAPSPAPNASGSQLS